jgi:hypothetical protein
MPPVPFYVSATSIAWLSAMLVCGVLAWFVSAFAAVRYDYAKMATMIMSGLGLFAAIALLGSGFSILLRRRLDAQTVFGWVGGALVGLLTFLLLIWMLTRAVMSHRPPAYALPLIPLLAFAMSGLTAILTSLLLPQSLNYQLGVDKGLERQKQNRQQEQW